MMDDNQNTPREWPIAPTFLSLRQGCTEDSANYNTDGIYYTDYLRGFLADLSHDKDIQNALSLFQFVPKDYLPNDPNAENPNEITTDPNKATVILNEPLDPNIKEILERQGKKIIRIDSGTYVNNGRLCDAFRKCSPDNTSFCFKQDSLVGIFADEELNELTPNTDEYRQRLERIIYDFNLSRKNPIKFDTLDMFGKPRRFYVHYTCPYSLFEEHFFPIYAQGRIIACLMFGQMARNSFEKEKSFALYWNDMKDKNRSCSNYLSEIIRLNRQEWDEKANAIVNRIELFERRLEDLIEQKNNRFINNEFYKIEHKFRKEVRSIDIRRQDAVSKFTEVLNQAFNSIKGKFDNSEEGFIRMFALPIDVKHNKLVPIGWSSAKFKSEKDDFCFSLEELKDIHTRPDFDYNDIILNAASPKIKDLYDKKNGDIFLPGWFAGIEVAYIVWKRHGRNLNNQYKHFVVYRNALLDFYSVALECYSYIRGSKMELLLETTIQESAHESAHFILPTIELIEKDIYSLHQDEILESLHQLREINFGSSLILSTDLQINKKQVEVIELLYKLKKTLNNRALDSHKSISYAQSKFFVTANIDVKYLNHALYNLLDNAIKYGYEGSYIRINMNVDKNGDFMIIEVVSYGIEMELGDRIYQLFARSENAGKVAGGTGLGLYIVKKICEAHGGIIGHSSEKLSDYNTLYGDKFLKPYNSSSSSFSKA